MISLVIPCYNEEDNLEKLLTKISFVLKKFSKERIEIVIVNNGSTDNSEKIIFKFSDIDLCRLKPDYNNLFKEYSYGE